MLENTQFGNPSRMTDKTTKSSLFEKSEKRRKLLAHGRLRMVVRSEITPLFHDGAVCPRHLGRCREG